MRHRTAAVAVLAAVTSLVPVPGCGSSFVAIRDTRHPAGGKYLVSATIEEWPSGYYSTAVTIRNVSTKPLALEPSMFRLEGTSPTAFVPAGRMPIFLGKAGFRMPALVEPRGAAQGEVFFGIRGSDAPKGPMRLVVSLPDGEHVFVFEFV